MTVMPGLRQFVSLVSKGGTPIMIADAFGNPYPTTGHGALVFNEGAVLIDPVLEGAVIVTEELHLPAGSPAQPPLTFGTEPYNTGFYSPAPGQLGISINGLPVVTTDSSGVSITGDITYSGSLHGAYHTPMTTRGDLYYMGAAGPTRLGIGPAGTTPVSNGDDLIYQPAATGNITSLTGTAGEIVATPSPITTTGSFGLANTTVIPGSYGNVSNIPQILVDQKGRITGVVNIPFSSAGSVTSVAAGVGLTAAPSPIVGAGTISHANSTVVAATYGSATQIPQLTVDARGHLTGVTNIAVTIPPAGVTSISTAGGSGITLTPNPIIATGTIAADTAVLATVSSLNAYLLKTGGTVTGPVIFQPPAPITTNTPAITVNQTWSNAPTVFYAAAMNITDTASSASSRLLSLQVGSADRFYVDKFGNTTMAASLNATQGTFSSAVTATTSSVVTGPAGGFRNFTLQTSGLNRWSLSENNTAEAGSDAGSDFNIVSYTDAGAFKAIPFALNRATGAATLSGALTGTTATFNGLITGRVDGPGTTTTPLYLRNNSTTANTGTQISLDPTANGIGVRDALIKATTNGSNQITLDFIINTGGGPVNAMSIAPTGNVTFSGNVASTAVGDTAPASPLDRQLWWNSNTSGGSGGGQLYIRYNDGVGASQWVPAAPAVVTPTSPGGDFYARQTTQVAVSTVMATIVFPTVVTGNTGSYYNAANGRWTPPAGRYSVFAHTSVIGPAAGAYTSIQLLKNGSTQLDLASTNIWAAVWQEMSVDVEVDMNGTDYIELQAMTGTAGAALTGSFGAFPISGVKGPPGDVGMLQMVSFETGAMATGTTVIPLDDTIPQITEGDQYMTLAITPRSATSKLIIDVTWHGANLAGTRNVVALFQDSTANALAASEGFAAANVITGIRFVHVMTSGTTSTTTFRVRAGPAAATTVTFNGAGAARLYGGVMASSIVIQEWP